MTINNSKGGRIEWIDKMRGIAIFSVVVQHLSYNFLNSGDFSYLNLIALSNMGVFFFVSGYILEKSCKVNDWHTALQYTKKKFIQLMIPFFFWGFASRYIFANGFESITYQDLYEQWRTPSLWYLLTLFGYIIPFSCYRVLGSITLLKKTLFWGIWCIILLGIWKVTGELKFATIYIPYFILGVFTSEYKKLENLLPNKWIGFCSVCLILLLTGYFTSGAMSIYNIIIKVLVTTSTIVILYRICNTDWNESINRFFTSCGKYSIAIYAIHWAFINISYVTNGIYTENELIPITLTVIIATIVSTICIYLKKLLDKFPAIDGLMFGGKWK